MNTIKKYSSNKMVSVLKKDGICISDGNKKLGTIHSFSLPSINTCPGKSKLCSNLCYAVKYEKVYVSTNKAYTRNFNLLQNNMSFVERKLNEFFKVYSEKHNQFRIHVAGDFYSYKYTKMWRRIIKKNRNINFTAYTRSWRIPEILKVLKEINDFKNTKLFLSVDKETGIPIFGNWNLAYLSENDDDKPIFPVTIVFRNKTNTVQTKINNSTVCPYEMGFKHSKKINCLKCMLCYIK